MKKLIITMGIILITLLGYSQVTNVGEFRIADATTAFGVNLPVGTKVYDVANDKYYVAKAGVVSTATLTTAAASFTLLNDAGSDDQTAAEVNITDAGGDYSSSNVEGALAEIGDSIAAHRNDIDQNATDISTNATAIAGISDTDDQTASEVNITDAGGKYAATTVEAALAEIANAGYLTSEVDGSNTNEIQTIDTARMVGTTLELSLSSDGEAKKEIDLSSLQDGTGTDDQGLSYNSSTHAIDIEDGTNAVIPLASSSNAGLLTAEDFDEIATNTAKETNVSTQLSTGTVNGTSYGITSDGSTDDVVLAAATTDYAGVMTATQFDKLAGIETGAEVNLTMVTEVFAAAETPVYAYSLGHSAVTAQGCVVSVNGAVLPATSYTLATNTITISSSKVPLYQYDQIVICYSY